MWQDYTATTLWMVGRLLAGDNWKLEPYIKFAYPNATKAMEETPEQIKDRIVRRLTT